jgi:hypothetical protein
MSAVVARAAVFSADRRVIPERIEFLSLRNISGLIPSQPFLLFFDDAKPYTNRVQRPSRNALRQYGPKAIFQPTRPPDH